MKKNMSWHIAVKSTQWLRGIEEIACHCSFTIKHCLIDFTQSVHDSYKQKGWIGIGLLL
jgi:hypothetical protein